MFDLYLHPMIVHFPIVFICLDFLLNVRYFILPKKYYQKYIHLFLKLTFCFILLSIGTGILDNGDLKYILEDQLTKSHFVLSLVLLLLVSLRLVFYKKILSLRIVSFLTSLVTFLILISVAHFGGKLAFG